MSTWGTADHPVNLDRGPTAGEYEGMQHIHVDGVCVKNAFGRPCDTVDIDGPRDEATRLREELEGIVREINRLPMEQCEAEGHSYNVVSEYETHEPLTVNCFVCGAIWPVGEKATKTEQDLIP